MEDDQDEDVIEIDEIDDDEDGNADDEYEEQLDDEAISSPAHISRQPTSTEAPVPRADLLLNIESPSVGDSLSPNEARRVGSDSLGAEGEEFLTPGIVTPTSLSSNREEEDWAREKQKGFVELDMDADADIMPDVVGGDELIPSSSPTFQQLPILRMLPTDESPSDLQQSSLAFSSPMEGSVRPLREQLPVVDTHRVEVPPHALDDDLPASSPILSSPVGPEHPQLHADSHGGRVLQAELADDIMDLNGLYDDIYTDPPQEIYELDVGMLEHAVGVVEDEGEDEGEEEDSVGPVAPSLMKSSDAEISPHNSCHGDDPAVLADNDEEYDELASSHGDGVASKPIVSATGVESERVAGHGPQLIQVGGFDTVLPADPPTAARRNVGTPRCLEPLLGFDGQLAQNPTPPIVFEATPLEHESMPLMNSGPSSSLQASRSCDETNTKGPGPFQHSRFLPSPPPDVDSHIPTQRETAIPSDIVDMRDRAAGMLEEIEQGLTSAEEFFIGAASDTIHGTSQKDGSRVSEVGNVPRGAVPEIDGVRRPDGHPELLESDVGVELDDDVSASRESITEKSPYAADSAGVSESASRCESNDEIMETCSQVSDAPPDASNADAPDIKIEVESPRPNIDGTTTPNSDLVISSPPPNTLLGILPPPVIADPNIPDPVFHAETQRGDDVGLTQRPQTPPLDVANSERNVATPTRIPLVLSMPSTPAIMLSPVGTPGTGRPTPVSVPIPASILMAFQRQKSRGGLATSDGGLAVRVGGPTTGPPRFFH
ncbi:hypothetical protein BD779DRAFT_147744 [Infundibulicybe gibba]|nr:hypothetical protein BD779DRAFT_147744 [Infundibulicybe gibba]